MTPRRRRRSWLWRLLLPLALAAGILLWRFPVEIGREHVQKTDAERFRVVRVLDGDTAELESGERVRLLGIDTPEHGELLADEARYLLNQLTVGRSTRLEFDYHRRDKYGRLLGFLYAPDPAHPEHELNLNQMLVDSGLAYVYLVDKEEFGKPAYKSLIAAQQGAIERRVGLWGMTRSSEPYYLAIRGSFRLHRPSCDRVAEHRPETLVRYADRLEALRQGFSPCRECKP